MNLVSAAVRAFLALCSPRTAELAHGAQRTAPSYLTDRTAIDHARAAVVAGAVYDVDPALLLSIAWHESRYSQTEVTQEVNGVSCGVMTPIPTRDRVECARATSSLTAGYLAGAQHLRTWIDMVHGNLRLAILGYAGGGRLIRMCQSQDLRACRTPEIRQARAAQIRRVPAS